MRDPVLACRESRLGVEETGTSHTTPDRPNRPVDSEPTFKVGDQSICSVYDIKGVDNCDAILELLDH